MPARPRSVQWDSDAKSKQRTQTASDAALKQRQSDLPEESLLET
jgi:hypothetical protein